MTDREIKRVRGVNGKRDREPERYVWSQDERESD